MYRVAESESGDLRLYIAVDHGSPVFLVYQKTNKDGNELNDEDDYDTGLYGFKCIEEDTAIPSRGQSIKSATEETMEYLIDCFIDFKEVSEEEEEQADKILEREEELSDAISEFLCVALYKSNDDAVVREDEFLDDVMRILYEKYGVNLYRPMILEDEKGEFFKEHPYPSLIYKMSDQVAGE